MLVNPGPETYAFGYEIKSPLNDNVQFREEEKFGDGLDMVRTAISDPMVMLL